MNSLCRVRVILERVVLRSRAKDALEGTARYGCSEGYLGKFICYYGKVCVEDSRSVLSLRLYSAMLLHIP